MVRIPGWSALWGGPIPGLHSYASVMYPGMKPDEINNSWVTFLILKVAPWDKTFSILSTLKI